MDTVNYKDVVCRATFELDEEGQVVLKTSFQRYSEQVWYEEQDLTYSYRTRTDLVGKECIIFTSCIDQHPMLPSEVEKADKDPKKVSRDWETAKKDLKVQQHYKLKKKDVLATTQVINDVETVIPYTGTDAEELHKPYGLFNKD